MRGGGEGTRRGVRLLACAALVAAAATRFVTRPIGGPEFDVWWMIVLGRIAGLRAAIADPLSFTAPGVWHYNHTFLHCALLAAVHDAGGLAGVWALKVALAGTLTVGAVAFLHARVRDPLALLLLGMLGFVVFVVPWLLMRPQLWTYLAVLALLVLMQEARDRTGWRLVLAVPLLAVWETLHGAVVVGLILLTVEAAGSTIGWLERRPGRAETMVRWGVVAAAVLVVWRGPYDVFAAVSQKVGSLASFPTTEWLPVWNLDAFRVAFPGAAGIVAAAAMAGALVGAGVVLALARRPDGGRFHREAVLLLVVLVLAARVIRNLPLLGLALVVLLAGPVDALATARARRAGAPSYGRMSLVSLGCGVAALAAVAIVRTREPLGADPNQYPVAACAWLARARPGGGTLMTDDPGGSYAAWCLPRTWRVSIDGREELLYPSAVLADHRALYGPAADAAAVVARWRPDAVLLPAGIPVAAAPAALAGYAVGWRDPGFVLWLRDDAATVRIDGDPAG